MLLIDRVLAADAETTRCRVTVGEQCSLFRQADGSYPNSLFIEFMAQTVGVFAGIRDSESGIGPRVGFLLGSRKVQLHKKTLAEGDVFDIDTRCLFFGQEELPSQFECRVLENSMLTAREECDELSALTRSEQVQVIGTKFVLYRPSHKKDKKDKIVLPKAAKKTV